MKTNGIAKKSSSESGSPQPLTKKNKMPKLKAMALTSSITRKNGNDHHYFPFSCMDINPTVPRHDQSSRNLFGVLSLAPNRKLQHAKYDHENNNNVTMTRQFFHFPQVIQVQQYDPYSCLPRVFHELPQASAQSLYFDSEINRYNQQLGEQCSTQVEKHQNHQSLQKHHDHIFSTDTFVVDDDGTSDDDLFYLSSLGTF